MISISNFLTILQLKNKIVKAKKKKERKSEGEHLKKRLAFPLVKGLPGGRDWLELGLIPTPEGSTTIRLP